jgi:phosphoribosylglycinamide formyltransferase-1
MPNKALNSLPPLRIAVLASGEGLTLQTLLDAIAARRLNAEIAVVVSNNADAGVLRRARTAGVPTAHISSAIHADAETLDASLTQALQAYTPDLVVTAGYMKRLGPQLMAAFRRRMINVHPSLLPKFGGQGMYGSRVHAAVLAAGEAESGASVHFVEGDYDSGPVIGQVRVPVLADDTVEALENRVKLVERELLLEVLRQRAETGRFGEEG